LTILGFSALAAAISLASPLALSNLFIHISKHPLLGYTLYETVTSVFAIAGSLAVLRAFMDRPLRGLVLGSTLCASSYLVLAFSRSTFMALVAAAMDSIGFAIMDPHFMDVLFASIPPERRGEVLGFLSSVRRVIDIAAPIACGALASIWFGAPFVAVCGLITLFLIATVRASRVGGIGSRISSPTRS